MPDVTICTRKDEDFTRFLSLHDFDVESVGENVYRVQREDELPVYLSMTDSRLYFEADLGDISGVGCRELYFQLLDLNTEIQPVSFGINNTNPDDPRLVLMEGREVEDLNDNELLAVFDALELAADKAEKLLGDYLNS